MRNLRDYAVITGTYWVFTLTDGAMRMLVLLYLHQAGRSPFEIASLFLFYEFFGILTNLFGGWVGARYGLKSTLFMGVSLQVASCGILAANANQLSIALFMVAQAMSGTAKDLTKMSSKSYVKLVVPEGDQRGLMRWVAILTGSKNTLKGVGFFLGGALLSGLGFKGACLGMAAALGLSLVLAVLLLPRAAGRAKERVRFSQLISRDPRVNWLSAARFFLFGSRDIWFVLALPIFLSSSLGWTHSEVGGFLALWVIGYGIVQALAPTYVGGKRKTPSQDTPSQDAPGQDTSGRGAPDAGRLVNWTSALVLPLGGIAAGFYMGLSPLLVLVMGLVLFGIVFATNSAIHSYLIIAYSEGDKVSLNVGFYYMANAAGRLVGTVLSGSLFQLAGEGEHGLLLCVGASVVFVLASAGLCIPLRAAEARWRN